MDVQQSLKQNRINLGLTQKEMAERMGVKQQVISRFESSGGTSLKRLVEYASCLDREIVDIPKVSKQFESSYLYQMYEKMHGECDVILSHVAALEALGLFSGYSNEYMVEYYSLKETGVPNTRFHVMRSPGEIGRVFFKGVYCTDVNRTLDDVLLASDRIDDTPILEALNTYYYENGQSFEGLRLSSKAERKLEEYADDAICY